MVFIFEQISICDDFKFGSVIMAFGKREHYDDELISYTENIDMLLHDLQSWGYKDLTKDKK